MKFGRGFGVLVVAGALAGFATASALADDFHHRDHDHGGQWWHGDIHHFHDHDFTVWRHGRWFHGPHAGRAGWWWIVGGIWYFYPAPVYPYPDPYVPPVAAPGGPPPYYYWCANPPGYYPQVPSCAVPWQAVPPSAPPPG